MNKNTEFVMYVDNFLDKNILKGLQNNFLNLNYTAMTTETGAHYGFRYNFPKSFYNDEIVSQSRSDLVILNLILALICMGSKFLFGKKVFLIIETISSL